jgi:DNA modification methylase
MAQTDNAPIDLDFDGHNTLYATHGLHAFAAKCPPQLAKFAITEYSSPGDTVLDPMAGSGTTLVEASLLGQNVIGFDIDPLACLIARVKSRCLDDQKIEEAYKALSQRISESMNDVHSSDYKRYIPSQFPNIDYWFSPEVKKNLAILCSLINTTPMEEDVRDFFWVAFSSIILSKVSVANARDIIHSRHHFFKHERLPNVMGKFDKRLISMRRQMSEFRDLLSESPDTRIEMRHGDARALPLHDKTIDLIFTSPPYATALDYPRAHFLAVGWMQEALGVSLDEYKAGGATYIGSARGRLDGDIGQDKSLTKFPEAGAVISQIAKADVRKGRLIQRYFKDMYQTLGEMSRVLKNDCYAIIVVCPSHIRKVEVPTHQIFAQMGSSVGLELIQEHTRTINARRRVLPYVRKSFGNRMSTEYVLIFKKHG